MNYEAHTEDAAEALAGRLWAQQRVIERLRQQVADLETVLERALMSSPPPASGNTRHQHQRCRHCRHCRLSRGRPERHHSAQRLTSARGADVVSPNDDAAAIDAILEAHRRGQPHLPADVVSELRDIRRGLTQRQTAIWHLHARSPVPPYSSSSSSSSFDSYSSCSSAAMAPHSSEFYRLGRGTLPVRQGQPPVAPGSGGSVDRVNPRWVGEAAADASAHARQRLVPPPPPQQKRVKERTHSQMMSPTPPPPPEALVLTFTGGSVQ